MIGRILVCAGSDSGAGAGIQADIKTVMALGGYATTAITALTVQNTLGVDAIQPVAAAFVRRQMIAVLTDIGADAAKTGMLANAAIVEAVAAALPAVPLVVDPVLVSTSGTRLLDETGVAAMRSLLFPRASVLTPNLPEAELLLGRRIADIGAMREAASALLATGAGAVLLKGGHLAGDRIADVLATGTGITVFEGRRITRRGTHGTGCTLASAVATGLGLGQELQTAVARARAYVAGAIRAAPGFGAGNGPLGHLAAGGFSV